MISRFRGLIAILAILAATCPWSLLAGCVLLAAGQTALALFKDWCDRVGRRPWL